ncbi:MAG: cysteine hydrolase [Firmicutes bacterium]|jgi:nicotinamidase-related amidase|nr:cysteine hydrolase [Bacillota bacterium]
MNYALLVIDLQKAFYGGYAKESMDAACESINAVLPFFRKTNSPVLWIQQKGEKEGVLPGTTGFELIDRLKPEPGDYRIHKEHVNSFVKTECAQILRESKTDIVVVTGFSAEYCVLSTYKGAVEEGFFPVILKNGIASGNKEGKEMVENRTNLISHEVLQKLLAEKL